MCRAMILWKEAADSAWWAIARVILVTCLGDQLYASFPVRTEVKTKFFHSPFSLLDMLIKTKVSVNHGIPLLRERNIRTRVFPVVMYSCESWRLNIEHWRMLSNCGAGEDSWESLGLQGDQTSQSWRQSTLDIIGRTVAEAEALVLWPPDVKSWLTGKYLDAGKDRRQEEKGMTEDGMVGWHHWLNGLEFGQTLEIVKYREAWPTAVQRVGHDLVTKQQHISWRLGMGGFYYLGVSCFTCSVVIAAEGQSPPSLL